MENKKQCGEDCPYSKFDIYDPLRSLGNYKCIPQGIAYDPYLEPLGYLICHQKNHLECGVYQYCNENNVEGEVKNGK